MKRRTLMSLAATAAAGVFGSAGASGLSKLAAPGASKDTPASGDADQGFLWVHDFAKPGVDHDDTAALQRAIDYVRDLAVRANDTSHLPALLLRAGRYALSDTIATAPWVKLCSIGGVLLDFSSLAPGKDGLVCRNETALPPTLLRFPGSRSPFLDGSAGTISLLGPGLARAEGFGVVMGNVDPTQHGAVRDAGGRNVVVSGWRGALRFDPVNVWMSNWTGSRFEQNREEGIYAAAPITPRSINSGERMTFFDCTIAGSKRALRIDTDSMDFVFDSCSFDFNGDVLCFDQHARYGTVALHHCHIEGIDGLLVDATHAGERLRVSIDNSILLPRPWKEKARPNAPRRLIEGRVRVAAVGLECRFERAAPNPCVALIDDASTLEQPSSLSFQHVPALPWKGAVLNADSDFQHDAPGASLDALTYWACSPGAKGAVIAVAEPAVNSDSARRQALVIEPPGTTNPVVLHSRAPQIVRPGEQIYAACNVEQEDAATTVEIEFAFSDDAGRPIAASLSLDGPSRARPLVGAVVPPGASRVTANARFTGFAQPLRVRAFTLWRL